MINHDLDQLKYNIFNFLMERRYNINYPCSPYIL